MNTACLEHGSVPEQPRSNAPFRTHYQHLAGFPQSPISGAVQGIKRMFATSRIQDLFREAKYET